VLGQLPKVLCGGPEGR